jgi:hypothetical protein
MLITRDFRFFLPTTLALAVLVGTSSCAEPAPKVKSGPYSAEILAAAKTANSDFERKILADGEITEAEYEEAVNKTIACTADHGFQVSKTRTSSGYNYDMVGSTAGDKAFSDCSAKFSSTIESFYNSQVVNPNNGDFWDLVLKCLKRKEVVPADYTRAKLDQEKRNGFKSSSFDRTNSGDVACLQNPSAP